MATLSKPQINIIYAIKRYFELKKKEILNIPAFECTENDIADLTIISTFLESINDHFINQI